MSLLGTATFGGNVVLFNNGTATTVTLCVTSLGFNVLGSSSPGALAFEPAPTITDSAGHAAIGTFTTAGTFRLF